MDYKLPKAMKKPAMADKYLSAFDKSSTFAEASAYVHKGLQRDKMVDRSDG